MSTREFKWVRTNVGTARLYTQTKAGHGKVDTSSDAHWYASIWEDGGSSKVDYWKLDPKFGDTVMDGDWVDLCACDTYEDAVTAAENALRLNLGGWP